MTKRLLTIIIGILLLIGLGTAPALADSPPETGAELPPVYFNLPLSFESNAGQMDEAVKYVSRGLGYTLFFTGEAVWIDLPVSETARHAMRMTFAGGNPAPVITAEGQQAGYTNYFRGSDPARWRSNVPLYDRVRYEGIYPGIDVIFYGNQATLEYDFVVAPGADPSVIEVRFEGTDGLTVDEAGDLALAVGDKSLTQRAPYSYQEVAGQRVTVDSAFVPGEDGRLRFTVGAYDPALPLYIDPVLVYSSVFGSAGGSYHRDVFVDAAGNSYAVGQTSYTAVPATVGDKTVNGYDAIYVNKINAAGSGLVWSTFLDAGTVQFSHYNDEGKAIFVDTAGNVYVAGQTQYGDFPITAGVYDGVHNGGIDGTVTKLTSAGAIVWSTFVGSPGTETTRDIWVGADQTVTVLGTTTDATFPVTSGTYDETFGGPTDSFITKLTADGSALVYSTFLGTNSTGTRIVGDGSGNLYVAGNTADAAFPVTTGAYDETHNGGTDGFIAKLNATGSGLDFSTFLGSPGSDTIEGLAVNDNGEVYVAGSTDNATFPVTSGAYDESHNGSSDIFITKLNAAGSGLGFSTFLGSSATDNAGAIALPTGAGTSLAVCGTTSATGFPVPGGYDTGYAGSTEVVVAKLSGDGSSLVTGSYFGGTGGEWCYNLWVDSTGSQAVIGGKVNSMTSFPRSGYTSSTVGNDDGYVARFDIHGLNNPGSATETHGVASNAWQSSVSAPSFTWTPASGAAGYYVYFGINASGTSTTTATATAAYSPPAVSATGTYYLRVMTYNSEGGTPGSWATLFTFNYDAPAATDPVRQWSPAAGIAASGATAANVVSLMAGVPDGLGGLVSGWVGADKHVYVQRTDGSGTLLWGADGVDLGSITTAGLGKLKLVTMGDGVVAVYTAGSGSSYTLQAQKITLSDGSKQWGTSGLTLGASPTSQIISVASIAANKVIIFYTQTSQVYGLVINTDTGTAESPQLMGPYGFFDEPVSYSPATGGAVLAYPGQNGSALDMRACRVDSAGNPLWTTSCVSLDTTTSTSYTMDRQAIVPDDNNGTFILWYNYKTNKLTGQRVDSSGSKLWGSTPLALANWSYSGFSQGSTTAVSDRAGGFYAVTAYGTTYDTILRVNSSGAIIRTWTPTIGAYGSSWVHLLADSTLNGVAAVYTIPSNGTVMVRRFINDGTTLDDMEFYLVQGRVSANLKLYAFTNNTGTMYLNHLYYPTGGNSSTDTRVYVQAVNIAGTPLPTAPTTTTETGGAVNNAWQSAVSSPAFTWSGATDGDGSGIKRYDLYWGASLTGTTVVATPTSAAYTPTGPVTDGTYYLRLRTRNNNDAVSDWATAFTFKYDGVAPTLPLTVTETAHGCPGWCNDLDVAFSWAAASDGSGSGQKEYDVYWGPDANGSTPTLTQTGVIYDPAATDGSAHYLRLRARDNAGNESAWATLFSYQYDTTPPTNPDTAVEGGGVVSGTWASTTPSFTLSGGSDTGAGIGGYNYYFGPNPSGVPAAFTAGDTITPTVSGNGTYYLRAEAVDAAGNPAGSVADLFTYQYDGTAPTAPTGAAEANGLTSGDWSNTAPSFTLSGGSDPDSGLAGYTYYFGPSASGTPATFSAGAVITPTLAGNGTYYLRVANQDEAGNDSSVADLFTFRYDTAAPSNPTTVTEAHAVTSNTWQNSVDTPAFTWSGAADGTGSGVEAYDIYWGNSAVGSTVTTHTTASSYTPETVTAGTYYLRFRTYDQAGNNSVWQTGFVFKFDDLAPTSPAPATETGGVISGTWQSTVSSPSFSWSASVDNAGGSGLAGYDVYWGDDPAGATAVTQVTSPAFAPGENSAGTYYLRLRAYDQVGNTSAWGTVFTFKYDLAPTAPTSVVETGGAISDTWQSTIVSPAFTWSGATDGGGVPIAGYEVYWGTSSTGTTVVTTTTGAAYEPGAVSNGTYYLRLRAKNDNGLTSAWVTSFIFKYDSSAPDSPANVSETGGAESDEWQATISSPAFEWDEVTEVGGSGVTGYEVYWGTNATGTTVVTTTTSAAYVPGEMSPGTYYLRLRTVDEAGNVSAWVDGFTFKYDLPPTAPTTITETGGATDGDWQNTIDTPAFTWAGGTDGGGAAITGYEVYWGDSAAGTTVVTTTAAVAYEPGTATEGTTYLRVRAKNVSGLTSGWADFTFNYDATAPTQPTTVTETGGAGDDAWQSAVSNPAFTWAGAADSGGSAIAAYEVYWGSNATGTTVVTTTALTAYDPGAVTAGTPYYLRLRLTDGAGNTSAWATAFTFKYDLPPTNPTTVTPPGGVVDDTWQSSTDTPPLTWAGATDGGGSPIAEYDVYWGPSLTGTTVTTTTTGTSYTPETPADPGVPYYLRLLTRNENGQESAWATAFTFKYDLPPTEPTAVIETGGAISNTWQSVVSSPAFTWSGATDGGGSSIAGYEVYWGSNASGTTVTTSTVAAAYDPGEVSNGTYYLRLRSKNGSGQASAWTTGFVFKYDATTPTNPTTVTETGGAADNTWQATVSSPAFTWSGAGDTGGSGVEAYEVYWGSSASGTTVITTTTSAAYTPSLPVSANSVTYLRLRTVDAAGNKSAWFTAFTFKYDLPPTNPTVVIETGGAISNTWQSSVTAPAFTWSGATTGGGSAIAAYDVYWGASSDGESVTANVTTAAYEPGTVGSGTRYLRIRTKNVSGLTSAWATAFVFKYDNATPTAPTSVSETGGTVDGDWQNTVSAPAFTWSGATGGTAGIAGYDVYWGTNASGTTVITTTTSAAYEPGATANGTRYLRIRTRGNNGLTSAWVTGFTFKYDSAAPTNPTTVSETGGATNDTWQSTVSSPAFTWSGAADTSGSGVDGYEVYWGASSSGTTVVATPTSAAYSPTGPVTDGTYYLRLRVVDVAGNKSAWATTFTFKYDLPPTAPTTVTETGGAISDTWQDSVSSPSFTWSGATANGGSSIAGYEVYWGTSSSGTTVVTTTTGAAYEPGAATPGSTYYLRLRSKNDNGLTSAWVTGFVFKYDAAPTAPTSAIETGGVISNTWQATVSSPAFTWSGATANGGSAIAGYEVYWGTSSSGATVTADVTTAAYAPGTASAGTTYYLRLRTKNVSGQTSAWTTGFVFKYDNATPTAPTTITETGGAVDGDWQNTVSAPAFTWSGASGGNSGIAGYDVYWGTNTSGTTVITTTTSAAYEPGATANGTRYLRIRTRGNNGLVSAWVTGFTFKYDSTAPTNPTTVSETGGTVNDVWQSTVSSPAFTWSGSADTNGSGVEAYEVYWGSSSSGTTVVTTTISAAYTPGAVSAGSPYYLRLRTVDVAGNKSAWATAFTFKYDLPPTAPTSVSETGGAASDTWQATVSSPSFTWSGATANGGSSIAGYEVYWGTSSSGTTVVTTTTGAAYEPGAATPGSTYYLRLRSKNDNGLTSAWVTGFVFKYDAAPTAPTTVVESSGVISNTWQATINSPDFTWSGATPGGGSSIVGYDVYWGTNAAGTTVTAAPTSAAYSPPSAVTNGVYYLRLRTRNSSGQMSAWATGFIFKYDSTTPTNPTTVTETGGAVNDTWQAGVSSPAFTWSGAADTGGSSIAGYEVYWGDSAAGTTVITTATSAAYEPGVVAAGSPYYLRLRTVDAAGNKSAWATAFTFKYDLPPTAPTAIIETGGASSNTWQSTVSSPDFTWSGAAANGGSSIAGYEVYWGTNAAGTTVSANVTTAAYAPGVVSNGTYYLRLRTKNVSGLTSAWTTGFIFKYDVATPTPPTTVTETGGVADNTWQATISSPAFTWSGATGGNSGIAGYDVYWGDNAAGTTVVTTTTGAAYEPGAVANGTSYLRFRTRSLSGQVSAWATGFTFKYDSTAPANPTIITEGHGVISGTWQADTAAPTFSWIAGSDGGGSGIASYDVYWGTDANGATVTSNVAGQTYAPGAVSAGTPYYLRLRTRDATGNVAAWVTAFIFKYDLSPTNPTTVTETGGAVNDTWQKTVYSPAFTWSGGSGAVSYDVYWGTSSTGNTAITTTTSAAYAPGPVANGTYYLRLRARNGNDQTAVWVTAFTFKFDNTPPDQITRNQVDEASSVPDGVWQAVTGDASFAWPVPVDAHSGVAKYQVYWGSSSTGVSASEQTSPTYDPAAIGSGTRYLRVKTYDQAGNSNQWQTLFEFKYDASAPTVVLEAPEFYPATLSFDVRWAVTDAESGPANCTVTWTVDSRSGYLVNNQPYASVKTAQHFENLSGKAVNLEATCANLAGSSTVVTATTTTVDLIPDTDSDEMPGAWETANGLDPNSATDANGDPDSDELTNLQEYQHGTDPKKADTDGDGLSDYDEVYALWNTANQEMAVMSEVGIAADSTTPIWWDSDGDGIGDGAEVTQGSDPLSASNPYNTALDSDGDGLPDGWETAYGYNPSRNSDATADTDGDGLTALQEYQYHTSPLVADTDQDGLTDGAEVSTYSTDPNSWDTDRDRFPDAMEVTGSTDPVDGNESPLVQDQDGDGMLDSWETANTVTDPTGDPDGDGLTNLVEFQKSTNPNAADTDGDGFNDGTELAAGTDPKDPASKPEGQPDTRPIYLPLIFRH